MRKAAVVFVIGVSVGVGLAAIHAYAQSKTPPPRMTQLSDLEKAQKPTPPGMDCTRTGFVTMSTNMMMSCPADFPC